MKTIITTHSLARAMAVMDDELESALLPSVTALDAEACST